MKTLAQSLDVPNATNQALLDAWVQVEHMKLTIPHKEVNVKKGEPKSSDIDELPIDRYEGIAQLGPNARGKFCIDILLDWEGEINREVLESLARGGNFDQMPDPFKPKAPIEGLGYYMQVSAREKTPKVWDIVKHYTFDEPHKYTFIKDRIIQGDMCLINWWKANTFGTKKIFQKIFEGLGGFQILFSKWAVGEEESVLSDDKRAAGYEYVRKHGPNSNNSGEWVEWADRKTHDEASPVYGWPEAKIKEFLAARHRGKQTAKTLLNFFTTYKDLKPWVCQNIMKPIAATHNELGVVWIGVTQCGKTLVAETHGFQVSIFQLDAGGFDRAETPPSILTAKYLDMFRGEPVTKTKPGIFDDGKFKKLEPPEVKAFLYPAEPDATLWARYGGSHFEHHASRQTVSQQFDKKFEKAFTAKDNRDFVDDDNFWKMVAPTFTDEADEEDILAFKRRFHIVLCSPTHVYFRHASRTHANVPRYEWDDKLNPDLFLPHVKERYEKFKTDQFEIPIDLNEGIVWSQEFIKKAMQGEPIPHGISVLNQAAGAEAAHYPPLMNAQAAGGRVKQEIWKLAKRQSGMVIDLSSSPAKKSIRSAGRAASSSASGGASIFPPMGMMALPVSPTNEGDEYDPSDVFPALRTVAAVPVAAIGTDEVENGLGLGGGMDSDDDMVAVKMEPEEEEKKKKGRTYNNTLSGAFPSGTIIDLDATPPESATDFSGDSVSAAVHAAAASVVAMGVASGCAMPSNPMPLAVAAAMDVLEGHWSDVADMEEAAEEQAEELDFENMDDATKEAFLFGKE